MEESTEAGGDAPRQSKLAEYLGALRPDTQVAVLRELELSELRGDALGPSFRVVMNELRRGIRKSGRKVERVGNPSRVFYMPVEPFLISEVPRAHRGDGVAALAQSALGLDLPGSDAGRSQDLHRNDDPGVDGR